MALTLKTSGIATNLLMCLAVDDNGTTIKEFVNSTVDSQKTIGSGVTTGSATWKGTSRNYFSTTANGTFDFYGITFGATKPTMNPTATNGIAFFFAFSTRSAASSSPYEFLASVTTDHGLTCPTSGLAQLWAYSASRGATTSAWPTSTKFSAGISYDTDDYEWFYGLESGSLASAGSGTSNNGWMESTTVLSLGGRSGFSNMPASFHIAALFDKKLSLTEMQSLHDDWFGTIFDTGGGPFDIAQSGNLALPSTVTLTGAVSWLTNFPVAQSGAIALPATITVSGEIGNEANYWTIPSNIPESTVVSVIVFSGTAGAYTIRRQGIATVEAGGIVRITSITGTPGDKALAFVHNWNDNTATTSIYGGAAIATRVDE